MTFMAEFRQFIARGNVVDLAVGVIIGGAFGKIVTSLVDQVIMPPIGLLTGGIDFSRLKWVLQGADPVRHKAEVAIQYGAFFSTLLQFLIIALVVFLLVRTINRLHRAPPPAPPAEAPPTRAENLLAEIRDTLAGRAP